MKHSTGLMIAIEDSVTTQKLIEDHDFNLENRTCSEICVKYNLPAITFFMKLTNYMDTYFKAQKEDTQEDI